MAVPIALAGAGIAARGFASYMAKKKAKEAAMKAGYGSVPAATMPNLVTTSKSINPVAGTAGLVASGVAGYGVGEYQNGLKSLSRNKGNYGMDGSYMASPSQDPSYDASMTREGQIQTMMEEMDGMNISEEAKRQIIADKLGVTSGVGFESQQDRTGSVRRNPNVNFDKRYPTESQLKIDAFDRIANDPDAPMEQRITAALRRESGAAYNEEEAMQAMEFLKGRDMQAKTMRTTTGASMTPNEMKMFMGRPVQTSGYDRGRIRPRYDEFGNLIPQRPTMMV